MAVKTLALPKKHLSLNYHILKLMTHSIYSMPHDSIYPPDVLKKTKEWLGISPFKRATLNEGLALLLKGGFVEKVRREGRQVYSITDKGRETYDEYVDVVTVWKIEKNFGDILKLHTVSEVQKKNKKTPTTHIPECAFFEWPLVFKPIVHEFDGPKEIRVFEAYEKVGPIG